MNAIMLRPGLLKAAVTSAALLLITGLLYATGFGTAWIGERIATLAGLSGEEPATARLLAALLIAGFLMLNGFALIRLPRTQQVVLIWVELAALLLFFFYSFDLSFAFIGRKIGFLITQGVTTTLLISTASIAIASALALVGAIAKLSGSGIAYGLATFYTSLFRGLPLLMQIYIIYLGLPQLGYVVGPVTAGIAALSLCYGAYMTEIFRAGIQSIARGQSEAATALGLNPTQTLWLVVMPQAMRVIIPPTGNQFISMLKDSSLVSVVGVWELMYLARTQGQTEFRHIEMLITASLIYWVLSMGLEYGQSRLEWRFARSSRR
jgi:polar amino acid transport system permease protein